jgi:hypothetical protein
MGAAAGGGVVTGVAGVVGTGGGLGFGEDGLGLGRFPGCGLGRVGSMGGVCMGLVPVGPS